MLQPNNNTVYTAALYCRLSKDDGFSDRDSSSIETQRTLLTNYCNEHGIIIHDYYVDDGYTGTNFDRPSFQRMIGDIENGKINCVITKDQSRLGRNHLEAGYFMEMFFPEHGVRYIAISDGVDTINQSSLDFAPFRNLLNDMYAKDVSVKIKTSLLAQQKAGKFFGTKAPYGYIKDPNDKHHLLIDERYAPVIRKIFDMYLNEGLGSHKIAKRLTDEKIPRPCVAASELKPAFDRYLQDENGYYRWTCQQVTSIIRNPVYAGHMRGQQRPKISFKSQKRYPLGSKAFVVQNTHEPIIDPERWELAQTILSSHRREKVEGGYQSIFNGILRCADCDHALNMSKGHRRKPRPDPIDMVGFQCNYYRTFGNKACTQHWIEARDLHNAVLADIRRLAKYAVDHDDKMVRDIISKLNADMSESTKKTERELVKAKKRLAELDKLFVSLYEDKVQGSISDRNYKQVASSYEQEQSELEKKINGYEEDLRTAKVNNENAETFVDMIKDYAGIEDLNVTIVHTLIDKIVVHQAEEIDGERGQKIEIYYKFAGKFDDEQDA